MARAKKGRFVFRSTDEKKTGLTLFQNKDLETLITVETTHGNPEKRVAAYKGWGAARHSRAPGDTETIFKEMGEKGVDPDKKLDATYSGYGHGSVGDGARIDVHFNNVPMHVPMTLFHLGYINSGQEKSTRYQQAFGKVPLHPLKHYLPESFDPHLASELEEKYQQIGLDMKEKFTSFRDSVAKVYKEYFKPDMDNGKEKGAFGSRVLDTARYTLLLGQNTGFAFETSARDWERKIAFLKGHAIPLYRHLGHQIETVLAPSKEIEDKLGVLGEAKALLKYTKPNVTTRNILYNLRDRLLVASRYKNALEDKKSNLEQETRVLNHDEGQYAIAQFILASDPSMKLDDALDFLSDIKVRNLDRQVERLSEDIFGAYTHHDEVSALGRTTGLTAELTTQIGEIRDWNRHKSVGRFIEGLPFIYGARTTHRQARQALARGFGYPLYLDIFPELKEEYKDIMKEHYSKVSSFLSETSKFIGADEDYGFMLNLLPLGHQSKIHMHMTPQDLSYIGKLRVRPGGHINYRVQAWEISDLAAKNNIYLSGLAPTDSKPDFTDREQFFNRS